MSGWLAKLFRGQSMSRDEFRQRVMGMTAPGVIASVGRPTNTGGDGTGSDIWMYYSPPTFDPVTGKGDFSIDVHFRGGRVADVRFFGTV